VPGLEPKKKGSGNLDNNSGIYTLNNPLFYYHLAMTEYYYLKKQKILS
jgi:hypothetical protein